MSSPVHELSLLHQTFQERFNRRDLEAMLELSAPHGVFVPQPGAAVSGAGVREALQHFLGLNLPITMTLVHTYVVGTVGLAIADWTIDGTGPDGSRISMSGRAADVAEYDDQHGWRFLIDNPFGTA